MPAPARPSTPLKVAYLVNQYPKVSHSFIRREMLALERAGVQVHRFAVRGWQIEAPGIDDADERARTRYLLQRGLPAIAAAMLRTVATSPLRFARAVAATMRLARRADRPWPVHIVYLAQACLLREWLRQSGAEHLHAHFGTNPAEVALLTRALGGPPYSVTVHGPEEFDKPLSLHLARKIHDAAFVAAVSSYGRSQLYRWAEPADWRRIEVVRCGLEPAFHDVDPLPVASPDRFVCVGRLCEQKGQLLLVEAVATLSARGRDVALVLAGDGEMRAAIEALVRARGIEGQVRITGWIGSEQVRAEILAARALVLPSFAEGLPVVLMEAMALRRAVVSTYVAGIPELVEPGRSGWLVPAGDVEALAAALETCLDTSPDELARMGEAARTRVLAMHDVDVEAARLAALFTRSRSPAASATAPAAGGRP